MDFLLGALLAALVVRGWLRGFVREAIGLAVLVIGTILAFRLSSPVGGIVAEVANTSPDVSRVIGGSLVFLVISLGAGIVGAIVHRGIRFLPGLPTLNRAGGAALAAGGGVLIATLVLSLLTVSPVPAAVSDQLDDSVLVAELTDPEGIPQRALDVASGDQVMSIVLRLNDLAGAPRLGDPDAEIEWLVLPEGAETRSKPRATKNVIGLVNEARVEADVAPLATSKTLNAVAASHAQAMYEGGWIAHTSPDGQSPTDRLAAAGIPYVTEVELIGLATSEASTVQAWREDPTQAEHMYDPNQRRIGAAVVSGPLGRLAVVVMTG